MSDDDKLSIILRLITNLDEKLDRHMRDEEGEISTLLDTVTSYREESDRRHTALIQSIQSYMEKHEDYARAFVLIDGRPDLEGHREDHLTRKQFSDWTQQLKRDVMHTAIKLAILGTAGWLGMLAWQAFIAGPKG